MGDRWSKKTLEFLRRPGESERTPTLDIGAHATIVGRTDTGCVREKNEDQFVVATLERSMRLEQCGYPENDGQQLSDGGTGRLMMVADGMGGQAGGEVASAVVVDAMLSYASTMMPWLRAASDQAGRSLADGLREAVLRSKRRMQDVARRKGFDRDMGTTLTLGYVAWPTLYLVHVGDSRAYLHRGGEMIRLTRDHNLAETMIRQKVMTEEEAQNSRFASVLTNAVTSSNEELEVELHQLELQLGDKLLLCTDGLYGEVTEGDIAGRLLHVVTPDLVAPCVESLVDAAKQAGGRDNVTAVLAYF
ncbi:MAG: protein phosphatase 2C domain-containing protein [Myxococcota bacterium]